MKTPDEIKKGLECCRHEWVDHHWKTCDVACPYLAEGSYCKNVLHHNAFAYIRQLELDKQQLEGMLHHMNQLRDAAASRALKMEERVRQLEAERDAAVKDIVHTCATCKHYFYNKADGSDCEYDCMDGPEGCHNGNTRW